MIDSSYVQELKRKENDLIRVYNPLDKPVVVEWDRKNGVKLFRVPAKQEEVLVRYIATKFIRETYDYIVSKKAGDAVTEANKDRVKKGMAKMTPWNEQLAFEGKFYSLSDDETKKILSILYVGLEREHGIDRLTPPPEKPRDDKTDFEHTLEDIEKEKGEVKPIEGSFKCDYPDCEFETETKIALFGHKKSHRTKDVKQKAVEGVSK